MQLSKYSYVAAGVKGPGLCFVPCADCVLCWFHFDYDEGGTAD